MRVHCLPIPVQVSAIVRAPPSDVFQNLVQLRKREGLGVLMGARVVEKIDTNTQARLAPCLCQPACLCGCRCPPPRCSA